MMGNENNMHQDQGSQSNMLKVLALQKKTLGTPRENLDRVKEMLEEAAPPAGGSGTPLEDHGAVVEDHGAAPDVILLPEIFTCPYDNSCFPVFAQEEDGEVCRELSSIARQYHVYLVGGSVPERSADGRIYNTSYVYDRTGRRIARHRKVHLFDIDVPGGQYFKESDILSPGEDVTVFDTEFGKMGVCICFDIRFPEMFLEMRKMGVRMVFVPAAFNMTTGPAHWEVLFRSRALDQQIYVLGCSPARDAEASYIAYGHTILTDPWGRVVQELDEKEGMLCAAVDLAYADSVRQQIPLGSHGVSAPVHLGKSAL